MSDRKTIAVVDDDDSVRESLPDLLKSFGFEVVAFASAEAFMASDAIAAADCIILDVFMPGMTGPELRQELMRLGYTTPVIFITAHSDEKEWPALLSSGAIACLLKPFSETAMLDAVTTALKRDPGDC